MVAVMNSPRTDQPHRRPPAGSPAEDEALFLEHLPVIDAAVAQVCHRYHLTAAEADDFASEVRLHFIERNYEPLCRFEGRSSLRTYLIVVVQHLFLDYRNRLWGKWRPSADAKRLGPIGILVERLVLRDGWNFDQVAETLRTNHGIEVTDAVKALYVRLAERAPARQFVADVEAAGIASPALPPDAHVVRAEQGFRAKRVQTALDRVMQSLTAEERLILKMHFDDAVSVADIARALHLNQKRLYRTIERLLAMLRAQLEADGIARDDVSALLADGAFAEREPNDQQERQGAAGTPQPAERTRTPWRK
jgi:RNA polymerase sigma factor (sigma-70 family)